MSFTELNDSTPSALSRISLNNYSACSNAPDTVATKAGKTVALCVLLVAALVGNILVVMIIYKNKNMRTTVNYFIMNMAVSDLIIPVFVIPRQILEVTSGSLAWRVQGAFGNFMCKFIYFISDITPPVSVLSLLFMTFDRFCAVAFPIKATLIPSFIRPLLIVVTWVVSAVFFAPYFHAFNLSPDPTGSEWFCILTWDIQIHKAFTTTICFVFIIIPFVLLTGLYTAILVILRRNRGAGEQMARQRKRRQKINMTVIKLALTIVLVFAVCWGPYNGVIFTLNFVWNWERPRDYCNWKTLQFVVQYLAYAPPAINPLIYFILNENYRSGLKRALTVTFNGRSMQNSIALNSLHSMRPGKKKLLRTNRSEIRNSVKTQDLELLTSI